MGDESMNPIRRMQAELAARLPDLSIEVDPPAIESGHWHLDVRRDGKHVMLVEWRPSEGFGFSTPKPDDAWSGHDEVTADYDRALDRISHLLETRGETIPPLPVRLAELRQARGLTQAELAERAGLAQANLSRVENQDDMKLATLQKIVTAMGASLSIVARFPDGSNWELRV
jgi:DNA-binding Xre family transcriptional regulator